MPFAELVATTDGSLKTALENLIAAKSLSGETDSQGRITILDDFITEAIERKEVIDPSDEPGEEAISGLIDREFREIISPRRHNLMRKEDFTLERVREADLLLFDAVSGSHAYGTQTPKSDVDRRGIFIAADCFHAGMDSIEQVADESTDEVYYELTRFFQLLEKNNPGALELLYTPADCVRVRHPAFDLIEPGLFLSKPAEKASPDTLIPRSARRGD